MGSVVKNWDGNSRKWGKRAGVLDLVQREKKFE